MDYDTIDGYIGRFPPEVRRRLGELRDFVRAEAPEAVEKISYGMPAFYLNGVLVYFAAFKDHYSFFPASSGVDRLGEELARYRTGKGTLSFSLDEPFPWELLRRVIRLRLEENAGKAKKRGGKGR